MEQDNKLFQEVNESNSDFLPKGYVLWRKDIQALIDSAKLKTVVNVNMGLLSLYWSIGKEILDKQKRLGWGKQVIVQLSKDLCSCYPDDRGYSERNLRNMKRFASEYPDFPFLQVPLAKLRESPIWQVPLAKLEKANKEFAQVPLAQISWYHHISLLSKVKDDVERAYYITETAHNGWSRDVMLMQIDSGYIMLRDIQSIILTRLCLQYSRIWQGIYSKTHTILVSLALLPCRMSLTLRNP